METFLTARLGHLPSPLWGGDGGGGLREAPDGALVAIPPTPSLPHEGGGEVQDLTFWRAMLREVAP
jgi:hypothetical protein